MTKEIIRNEDLRRLRQKAQEVIQASKATVAASQMIRKDRCKRKFSELQSFRDDPTSCTQEDRSESAQVVLPLGR